MVADFLQTKHVDAAPLSRQFGISRPKNTVPIPLNGGVGTGQFQAAQGEQSEFPLLFDSHKASAQFFCDNATRATSGEEAFPGLSTKWNFTYVKMAMLSLCRTSK